jgi:hypothetical protein
MYNNGTLLVWTLSRSQWKLHDHCRLKGSHRTHAFAIAPYVEWYRILYACTYYMSIVRCSRSLPLATVCVYACVHARAFFMDRLRGIVFTELSYNQQHCLWYFANSLWAQPYLWWVQCTRLHPPGYGPATSSPVRVYFSAIHFTETSGQ